MSWLTSHWKNIHQNAAEGSTGYDAHIKMKEQMVNVYIIACKREPRFSLSSNSKNISRREGKCDFTVQIIEQLHRGEIKIYFLMSASVNMPPGSRWKEREWRVRRGRRARLQEQWSPLCAPDSDEKTKDWPATHTHTTLLATASSSCSGIFLCILNRTQTGPCLLTT